MQHDNTAHDHSPTQPLHRLLKLLRGGGTVNLGANPGTYSATGIIQLFAKTYCSALPARSPSSGSIQVVADSARSDRVSLLDAFFECCSACPWLFPVSSLLCESLEETAGKPCAEYWQTLPDCLAQDLPALASAPGRTRSNFETALRGIASVASAGRSSASSSSATAVRVVNTLARRVVSAISNALLSTDETASHFNVDGPDAAGLLSCYDTLMEFIQSRSVDTLQLFATAHLRWLCHGTANSFESVPSLDSPYLASLFAAITGGLTRLPPLARVIVEKLTFPWLKEPFAVYSTLWDEAASMDLNSYRALFCVMEVASERDYATLLSHARTWTISSLCASQPRHLALGLCLSYFVSLHPPVSLKQAQQSSVASLPSHGAWLASSTISMTRQKDLQILLAVLNSFLKPGIGADLAFLKSHLVGVRSVSAFRSFSDAVAALLRKASIEDSRTNVNGAGPSRKRKQLPSSMQNSGGEASHLSAADAVDEFAASGGASQIPKWLFVEMLVNPKWYRQTFLMELAAFGTKPASDLMDALKKAGKVPKGFAALTVPDADREVVHEEGFEFWLESASRTIDGFRDVISKGNASAFAGCVHALRKTLERSRPYFSCLDEIMGKVTCISVNSLGRCRALPLCVDQNAFKFAEVVIGIVHRLRQHGNMGERGSVAIVAAVRDLVPGGWNAMFLRLYQMCYSDMPQHGKDASKIGNLILSLARLVSLWIAAGIPRDATVSYEVDEARVETDRAQEVIEILEPEMALLQRLFVDSTPTHMHIVAQELLTYCKGLSAELETFRQEQRKRRKVNESDGCNILPEGSLNWTTEVGNLDGSVARLNRVVEFLQRRLFLFQSVVEQLTIAPIIGAPLFPPWLYDELGDMETAVRMLLALPRHSKDVPEGMEAFRYCGPSTASMVQLLRSWLTTACGKMSLIDSTQFCDSILHRWLLCTVRTVVGRDEDQFGKSSSPGELHTTVDSEAAVMCLALRDVVSLDLSRPMHSISLRSSWLRDLLASAPESLAPLLAQTCRLLPGTWLWTGAFGTSCPDSHLLEEACREWEAWAIRCCRNHSLRRGLREMMTFAAFATDHFSWFADGASAAGSEADFQYTQLEVLSKCAPTLCAMAVTARSLGLLRGPTDDNPLCACVGLDLMKWTRFSTSPHPKRFPGLSSIISLAFVLQLVLISSTDDDADSDRQRRMVVDLLAALSGTGSRGRTTSFVDARCIRNALRWWFNEPDGERKQDSRDEFLGMLAEGVEWLCPAETSGPWPVD